MFHLRLRQWLVKKKGLKRDGLLTIPGTVSYTFSKGKRFKGNMNRKISCFLSLKLA